MIYWAVVSVFKDSSIKFQYYFYKFKEASRKKSFSRTEEFFQEYSRPVRTMFVRSRVEGKYLKIFHPGLGESTGLLRTNW